MKPLYEPKYIDPHDLEKAFNEVQRQTLAPETKSWNSQVDGSHYKDKPIQPMELSMANNLDALQHSICKYVMRFRDKHGKRDLLAARHCLDMLIDWEYRDEEDQ